MKKLLAVLLVLVTAATANAAVTISAESTPVPVYGTTNIAISTDGEISSGLLIMGLTIGSPASFSLGDYIPYYSSVQPPEIIDDPDLAAMLGIKNFFIEIGVDDIPIEGEPPPIGLLVDNIIFHCEGLGDATIKLFDSEPYLLDSLVIQQTPEPATIALLGLGALLLRRKSKI